jgi:ELWxxDGT repeat protein
MNTSFWSQCQGLVRRLQQRRLARPRERQRGWCLAETLEARALLSSTPALVADINPGPESSLGSQQRMAMIGTTIYFGANDGMHGFELWKSDGTAAGTTMLADINPGAGSSLVNGLTNVNGTLYFTAWDGDGAHGYGQLWKSDGTTAGTTMVKDIYESSSHGFTNVNGTLYFSANDGVHGYELWKSDGTTAGTMMVKDISSPVNPGPYSNINSYPSYLTNVNGTLFFSARTDSYGAELWKSDGTVAGTTMVKDIYPGWFTVGAYGGNSYGYSSSPKDLANLNGTLFFFSRSGGTTGLWKSDGTEAGTVLVSAFADLNQLTNVNGTLYFTASDELWKSDGTAAGTMAVKDINPAGDSSSGNFTNVNGTLYFTASDGVSGIELWKSDGTAAGTVMVKDISPGGADSLPNQLTDVNGTLYFTADDGIHGEELWKSDGTAAGTVMVTDINPGSGHSYVGNLTHANGTLFFTANDGVHGTELWALTVPSLGMSLPATTTAGSAASFTITAKNADGTTNTGYLGTVHFTSTDPQAVLPADYIFTALDRGVHNFIASLKTAGSQSITAKDTQGLAAESSILVKASAVSTMTVGGFSSIITAGVTGNVTVTLKDSYGNVASDYTGTVHFTSSDAKAVLPANYTFTAADAGKHSFGVTLKTAGTRSITVADTTSAGLAATQSGITVKAGAASQFLIGAPSSVTAGVPFSLALTVEDVYGNVVTDYTGTVRFTSTDRSAVLPPSYTFPATDHGVHTFTGLILRKKGSAKITITDTLNSSLTSSVAIHVQ